MSAHVRPRQRLQLPSIRVLSARIRSATTTIIAIAVVGAAVIMAAWINAQARETAAQAAHSIEIREGAERFLGHLRDAETGQRGYLLTGDRAYLAPFVSGRAAALPELDALEKLVAGDPGQTQQVAKARDETRLKLAELEASVALMRQGRQAEAITGLQQGLGVTAMDALRVIVRQIQLAENIRLAKLTRGDDRRRILASTGIVVALAGLAFAAWQQLRTRQRQSRSLATTNAELEQIVGERTQQLESERLRIESLLRDVNHRVGNNLAMVSALLNVQSRQTKEPSVRHALGQAQSRIQAIAAGQRRLRLDIETDEIDARPYMEDLVEEIGKGVEGRPISIELDIEAIRLPGRDAVSFVVIVNELVTNAIKHAFPDNMPGRIIVRFREAEIDGIPSLILSVEDDGVGIPETIQAKGLGQTVVSSLCRSMHATIATSAVEPDSARPGSRTTLTFPERTLPQPSAAAESAEASKP